MITEPITPELLTIQQVADRVGLTRQALYPRLDRDLSEFYVEVDGKKMLKSNVVEYILSKSESKVESKIDDKSDIRLLDALQAEIEILKEQLKIKDQQLAAADERLHESHVLNLNLSERGRQLLQAAINEAADTDRTESDRTDTPEPPPDVPPPPAKKGFWRRFFGGK